MNKKNKTNNRPKMHPRNIYKDPTPFNELAKKYPEFKENTTIDLTGRVRLNFKDPAALRALSRTLLMKDFNLDVDFPVNALVPTIPLRLNYILFIEDLLNYANINKNVKGLDIGTGASCVYPLIAARQNSWSMVGTDIRSESIKYAKQNVAVNKLEHKISVVEVKDDSIISEVLQNDETVYEFCMCNPPFFGMNELVSQHKGKPSRPPPSNASTGVAHEVSTRGGEVAFVTKMIDESCNFQKRIRIFTSMLGIKRSIKPLLAKLKALPSVKETVITEFYQGHTTRFGIAWTFDNNIHLEIPSSQAKLLNTLKNKQDKPLLHIIKPFSGNINEVDTKLKKIFDELQFEYTLSDENENALRSYDVMTYSNTWSHNRRKVRELSHKSHMVGESQTESQAGDKRKAEDNEDINAKRPRTEEDDIKEVFLECTVDIVLDRLELLIKLEFIDGPGGKSAANGVLQHIKNHLKV